MSKRDYFRWSEAGLPCPAPLEIAVEQGVFGVCSDGPICPGSEEVAAITEEHARELAGTLYRQRHLERCLKRHLNQHTGRPLRDWEIREREERSMQQGVAKLKEHYAACLGVYADAFGFDAADALDKCIQAVLELPEFALEEIEVQQTLF